MKTFLDDNFLLDNKTAEMLYHEYAKGMPIFDYHCHLSPKEIAEDKKYRSITELWLAGDHYKWRAMRINGVEERYITGDASDKEKFLKWAETISACIGNPLYHWTHMELRRYFGIDKVLSLETAEEIWEKCNEKLKCDEFSVRNLIKSSNVKVICTNDDPVDSLDYHAALSKDNTIDVQVLPSFRPDKGINIEKAGFVSWILCLGEISGLEVHTFEDLKRALIKRIEFFDKAGCRLSDHGLDPVVYRDGTEQEAEAIFAKALVHQDLTEAEIEKYKTQILLFLGREYSRRNWAMQLHIGAMRDNNVRMMNLLGSNTGFDAMGDSGIAEPLAKILNSLDETNELPKTILYCLNPKDNDVICTISGCFQGNGGIGGKVQFGSGWWFNDQRDGMIRQMTSLANLGLLSRFIGMLTDSRSFISYTRHEYFRRILCNLLGEWVEKGEVPNDIALLKNVVQDICYNNAKNYFG